jgi:hypothetical protein
MSFGVSQPSVCEQPVGQPVHRHRHRLFARVAPKAWPLAAVNVNVCQARYGLASGISPLM